MFANQRIGWPVRWMMNINTEREAKLMEILIGLAKAAHDAESTGEHSHKCDKCGHIWSHEDSCLNDKPHHTCKCGAEQWYVFKNHREGLFQSCAVQTPERRV